MPPCEKPIVMAERQQIEEFDEISNKFFSSVLEGRPGLRKFWQKTL